VQEVNRLLAQFEQMQTMMKQFKGGKMARAMAGMAAKGAAKGLGGLFKK
jgi:signal recognition particle subunit SRP54